ncbi:hypothetical protein E05_35430 [Plautia stali symbiont]|nr:hypothetical protein E05_35430 [Plautia stali symbiont]
MISGNQFGRDVAKLFQRLRAPFSAGKVAGVVDTLKLMLPQQAAPQRQLIGFRNGVLDTRTGTFSPHRRENWLRTVSDVDYTRPVAGETLERHAPHFWQWLDRAAGRCAEKRDIIVAALFMVLANRYDWQLFLEVTGPGGSGKSIMAEIATMLVGPDNAVSATIETLESSRERASVIDYSLIRLPDQEKWSGDGAGIKAITGGDAVSVDPKYKDAYLTHIPAVILAVNKITRCASPTAAGRLAPAGYPALPENHPGRRARPAAEGEDTGGAGRYCPPADAAVQPAAGRPRAASVAAELRGGDAHQARRRSDGGLLRLPVCDR